eukprot:2494718-Rhodomonas_salina.6
MGIGAVRQYQDQETMWAWLHEACKYSDKARTIIAHAMMNKAHPEFATEAWKAVVRQFNPANANARNTALQENELCKKIAWFNCEWLEWIQDTLHYYMLLIEAGLQITESELIQMILKVVSGWAAKHNTPKGSIWVNFVQNSVTVLPLPLQLAQVCQIAEEIKDRQVLAKTYMPKIDPESYKFANLAKAFTARQKEEDTKDSLTEAYANVINCEMNGGYAGLNKLSNLHLQLIGHGVRAELPHKVTMNTQKFQGDPCHSTSETSPWMAAMAKDIL